MEEPRSIQDVPSRRSAWVSLLVAMRRDECRTKVRSQNINRRGAHCAKCRIGRDKCQQRSLGFHADKCELNKRNKALRNSFTTRAKSQEVYERAYKVKFRQASVHFQPLSQAKSTRIPHLVLLLRHTRHPQNISNKKIQRKGRTPTNIH
jgi:hypothetical protein